MKWIDHGQIVEVYPPAEFNFSECLVFLNRSDNEVLHQIKGGNLYKLLKLEDELIVCKISSRGDSIQVEFPSKSLSLTAREAAAEYIWEWFDLDKDLRGFYEMARQDEILQPMVDKYYGLRIMCIPDLFEALSWAIIGQQINLTFAYTLKKRLVEHFGESLTFEGENFWLFPSFEKIASIEVEDLRKLQFTARKAEYIIGVAKAMANGILVKEDFLQEPDYLQIQKSLLAVRGIGAWTADYVRMKCFHHSTAFPIADVGLHHALKNQLGLHRKPTIKEMEEISKNWEGWQAYAAFYLWRSLYE